MFFLQKKEKKNQARKSWIACCLILMYFVIFRSYHLNEQILADNKQEESIKNTTSEVEITTNSEKIFQKEFFSLTLSTNSKLIIDSVENSYMQRKIQIKVSGLTEEAILLNSLQLNSTFNLDRLNISQVKKVSVEYSQHEKMIEATICISLDSVYEVQSDINSNQIKLKFYRPKDVYKHVLVVDAGHGGKDSGAISKDNSYYEKDINLSMLLKLKELLIEKNIKVYYTRVTDEYVESEARVRLANDIGADLFLSIHCNSAKSTEPNGTWVLYQENSQLTNMNSMKFANIMSKAMEESITLSNGGLFTADHVRIIKQAKVPVALIEVGFMSNQSDLQYLLNENNQEKVASGLYKGIKEALLQIEK